MRMSGRLIVCFVLTITLVSVLLAVYQARVDNQAIRNEFTQKARLAAESFRETVELLPQGISGEGLRQEIERLARNLVAGVVIHGASGAPVVITHDLASRLGRNI